MFKGVLAIYAVLQTRFEYLAQHMFFLNRVQQTVMHDFGPVLIALAWPGAAMYLGIAPLASPADRSAIAAANPARA